MATEMGLGTCGVCENQIGEGVPIGVLSHSPFIMGHKECVDKKKAEQFMVKISKQDGPGGPIGEYFDAVESTTIVDKKGVVEPEPSVIVEPEPPAVGVSDPWNGPPTEQDVTPMVPEGGFLPEHFPALSVDLIPYTSNPAMHSDPDIAIQSNGWAFIHVGNVRVAIPDREEWDKLVAMMEAMWNTHELHAHAKEVTDGSTDT